MKNKDTVIAETVATIQTATSYDERHTPDVAKAIGAAYDAGQKAGGKVEVVPPLTDAEISAFRGDARARGAKKKK